MSLLRLLLFVPGHRGSWVEQALASGADGLILELEDSVPDNLKADARAEVGRSIGRLRGSGSKAGVYVRVNALDTGLSGDDIEAVVVPGLDGLSLPKSCR